MKVSNIIVAAIFLPWASLAASQESPLIIKPIIFHTHWKLSDEGYSYRSHSIAGDGSLSVETGQFDGKSSGYNNGTGAGVEALYGITDSINLGTSLQYTSFHRPNVLWNLAGLSIFSQYEVYSFSRNSFFARGGLSWQGLSFIVGDYVGTIDGENESGQAFTAETRVKVDGGLTNFFTFDLGVGYQYNLTRRIGLFLDYVASVSINRPDLELSSSVETKFSDDRGLVSFKDENITKNLNMESHRLSLGLAFLL